ncbi:hypothetical protein B7P43_G02867 [Cryptotermes secundus]|uniref:Uncharacterized protein n=1 Tax=Cryptotermes secundus TaxID=105785 RepID=A0A2J7QG49_9NEOP|nr:hypothetical protein B7P43_G02867 [Cryptotermes secundus]
MLLSLHWNLEKNRDINIANKCFENVAQFKYFGTIVINQNILNSSRLLSKKVKIRMYKTIILPVVLYERKILSLTLMEKHRLTMKRVIFWV